MCSVRPENLPVDPGVKVRQVPWWLKPTSPNVSSARPAASEPAGGQPRAVGGLPAPGGDLPLSHPECRKGILWGAVAGQCPGNPHAGGIGGCFSLMLAGASAFLSLPGWCEGGGCQGLQVVTGGKRRERRREESRRRDRAPSRGDTSPKAKCSCTFCRWRGPGPQTWFPRSGPPEGCLSARNLPVQSLGREEESGRMQK